MNHFLEIYNEIYGISIKLGLWGEPKTPKTSWACLSHTTICIFTPNTNIMPHMWKLDNIIPILKPKKDSNIGKAIHEHVFHFSLHQPRHWRSPYITNNITILDMNTYPEKMGLTLDPKLTYNTLTIWQYGMAPSTFLHFDKVNIYLSDELVRFSST